MMPRRIVHMLVSLASVVTVYWLYALVAVPLIEPRADPRGDDRATEEQIAKAREDLARRLAELRPLFPPGHWVLENAKVLQSEQVRLLIGDYRNLNDGRVELRPCAMVFTPHAAGLDRLSQIRQSTVLEAPEGAILQFDEPFDLQRARIGRLIHGQLNGRVTIRSEGKQPGPHDDLLLVTRDLQMTEDQIFTAHPVEFRYGPNYGSGRDMIVKLLRGEGEKRGGRGLKIAGMESFEIRRLDRLHLEVADRSLGNGRPQIAASPMPAGSVVPIEISCQGPFRFSPTRNMLTLEDHVDVMRLNPQGPSDQLTCDRLTVMLKPGPARPGAPSPAASFNFQPQRMEAVGTPVVLRAPLQQVEARGQNLQYDLEKGLIVLGGGDEVFLRQGGNEIHARDLQYQSGERGRMGLVTASGPGWLRGEAPERPGQVLKARWNEALKVRPDGPQQLISLVGGAGLNFNGLGDLTAVEIHFWLFEGGHSPSPGPAKVRPDRLLARRDVRLNSPQLTGAFEELGVWFEEGPAPAQSVAQGVFPGPPDPAKGDFPHREEDRPIFAARKSGQPAGYPADQPPSRPSDSRPPRPASAVPAVQRVPAAPVVQAGLLAPAESASPSRFDVNGKVLRARVVQQGGQAEMAELTVEENVRFAEMATDPPGERPLLVTGDRLVATDVNRPHACVTVTGKPAHFEGRGLGLTGANINLNRGTNRLWIDGPGVMDLPMDRDLQGRPQPSGGVLQVQWQERMNFDGTKATFEETVIASSRAQRLQTERLEVSLQQPIRFDSASGAPRPDQSRPQISQILCSGGVLMESRTDGPEGPVSFERVAVADLGVNLASGHLAATGPGQMTTVRLEGADPLRAGKAAPAGQSPESPTAAAGAESPPAAPADGKNKPPGLVYLDVRFQRAEGNFERREMAFSEQVKAVYGPVAAWDAKLDADNPDQLATGCLLLNCNRMTVVQMPSPTAGPATVELTAENNVRAEVVLDDGRAFAQAVRMSYAEAKDLLILEGDGRAMAEISHQKYPGAPLTTTSARKIYFWPHAQQLSVDGVRRLEINDLPLSKPRP